MNRERQLAYYGPLVMRVVDRMMQFRLDRARAMVNAKGPIPDEQPEGLTRFDEAKAIIGIVSAHQGPTGIDSCGDAGESERLYGLSVGHVLTDADVRDIETLIADNNEEIGNSADKFAQARVATLHEIGGPELVKAVEAHDETVISEAVASALARFRQQDSQIKAGVS